MASDFAQHVKEQADIVKIIGEYVRLKKAGAQNFTGLCPFHKEKTPSFSVHAGRQFFNCFGCHEHGDVFTFVQKIENVGFSEAVRTVAQKCGIPLPKREFSSPEEAAEHRQRGKLLELHEAATAWFEEQLRSPKAPRPANTSPAADSPPRESRNSASASPLTTSTRCASACSPSPMPEPSASPASSPGKSRKTARPARSTRASASASCFPSPTRAAASSPSPRARWKPAKKPAPNTSTRRRRRSTPRATSSSISTRRASRSASDGGAVLVEGQMDCISVFLARHPQRHRHQRHRLHRSAGRACCAATPPSVIVNFDPDTAGANAAEKSIALLTEEGFEVRVLTLEGGLDPDRYVRERGARAYAEALRAAPPYQDYLVERARQSLSRARSQVQNRRPQLPPAPHPPHPQPHRPRRVCQRRRPGSRHRLRSGPRRAQRRRRRTPRLHRPARSPAHPRRAHSPPGFLRAALERGLPRRRRLSPPARARICRHAFRCARHGRSISAIAPTAPTLSPRSLPTRRTAASGRALPLRPRCRARGRRRRRSGSRHPPHCARAGAAPSPRCHRSGRARRQSWTKSSASPATTRMSRARMRELD